MEPLSVQRLAEDNQRPLPSDLGILGLNSAGMKD